MLTYSSNEAMPTTGKTVMVGLGGVGCHVFQLLEADKLPGCTLCSVDLDLRRLEQSATPARIHLGSHLTHGLGTGGDPVVGKQAALDGEASFMRLFDGCSLAVIVAGLGRGTGSGALPVIARLARELGIFLVVVATLPFRFEGDRSRSLAQQALEEVSSFADIVIPFDNEIMFSLMAENGNVLEAYEKSNVLLKQAVEAIPMLSRYSGLIQVGLDDLRAVMFGKGRCCLFGYGLGRGVDKAVEAVNEVMKSPFLQPDGILRQTAELLVHISGGNNLNISDIRMAMDEIGNVLEDRRPIHFGVSVCPELGDSLQMLLFASVGLRERIGEPVLPQQQSTEARLVPPLAVSQSHLGSPGETIEPETSSAVDPNDKPATKTVPGSAPAASDRQDDVVIIHSPIDPGAESVLHEVDQSQPEEDPIPVFPFIPRPSSPAHTPPVDVVLPKGVLPLDSHPEEDEEDLDEEQLPPDVAADPRFAPDRSNPPASQDKDPFSPQEPFIVDGENLDVPPLLRKKKSSPSKPDRP